MPASLEKQRTRQAGSYRRMFWACRSCKIQTSRKSNYIKQWQNQDVSTSSNRISRKCSAPPNKLCTTLVDNCHILNQLVLNLFLGDWMNQPMGLLNYATVGILILSGDGMLLFSSSSSLSCFVWCLVLSLVFFCFFLLKQISFYPKEKKKKKNFKRQQETNEWIRAQIRIQTNEKKKKEEEEMLPIRE